MWGRARELRVGIPGAVRACAMHLIHEFKVYSLLLLFPRAFKGVLGFESLTRGRVGRLAGGRQKKNVEPLIKLS